MAVFPAMAPGFSVQFPIGKPLNTALPVEDEQVVCVIELTVGAEGVTGCALIVTLTDAGEVHPEELVTVNVFTPGEIPVTVLTTPVPVIAPGFMVHVPNGKFPKSTLPVARVHVGCVTAPVVGADGVNGCVFITILADAEDVHPEALVTVKL